MELIQISAYLQSVVKDETKPVEIQVNKFSTVSILGNSLSPFGLCSEYGSVFYRKFRWHLLFRIHLKECNLFFKLNYFSASSCSTAVNLALIVPLSYLLLFISFFMSLISFHIQALFCFLFKVDASKTSTLEASAKPEPPPAPKPEEKKAEKKPSPFANLLKPKVNWLGGSE